MSQGDNERFIPTPEPTDESVLLAMHMISAGIGPIDPRTAAAHWQWMSHALGRAWGMGYASRVGWVPLPDGSGNGIACALTTRGNRALKAWRRRMQMPEALIDIPGRVVDQPDIPEGTKPSDLGIEGWDGPEAEGS